MQILQPHSLVHDATWKPFGRINIYIDRAKVEGSSSKIPVNLPNGRS